MEIIKWIYKVNKKRLENLKNEQEGAQMKILDIFSWVPEMEITLEDLMAIFENYKKGNSSKDYKITEELPPNASQNIIRGSEQLIREGKRVAFIIKECKIVVLIGIIGAVVIYKKKKCKTQGV